MAHLKLFTGCMASGKSTALLQTNHDYTDVGYKILIIKSVKDTRDGVQSKWGTIKSRLIDDNISCFYVDKINVQNMKYIIEKYGYNMVLVDEAQFLSESDIWVLSYIVDNMNINVLCYGIKTDSNGHLFDGIKQLIAIADRTIELDHICSCCGEENANMHVRYVNGVPVVGGDVIAVEGVDNIEYKSVCRKCWKKLTGFDSKIFDE